MDQSQDLIMKIKRRLIAQPKEGYCTEVRTLVGKKGVLRLGGTTSGLMPSKILNPRFSESSGPGEVSHFSLLRQVLSMLKDDAEASAKQYRHPSGLPPTHSTTFASPSWKSAGSDQGASGSMKPMPEGAGE